MKKIICIGILLFVFLGLFAEEVFTPLGSSKETIIQKGGVACEKVFIKDFFKLWGKDYLAYDPMGLEASFQNGSMGVSNVIYYFVNDICVGYIDLVYLQALADWKQLFTKDLGEPKLSEGVGTFLSTWIDPSDGTSNTIITGNHTYFIIDTEKIK